MPTTEYSLGWCVWGERGKEWLSSHLDLFVHLNQKQWPSCISTSVEGAERGQLAHSLCVLRACNSQLHQCACAKAKFTSINCRPRDGNQRQQPYHPDELRINAFFQFISEVSSHWATEKNNSKKSFKAPSLIPLVNPTFVWANHFPALRRKKGRPFYYLLQRSSSLLVLPWVGYYPLQHCQAFPAWKESLDLIYLCFVCLPIISYLIGGSW